MPGNGGGGDGLGGGDGEGGMGGGGGNGDGFEGETHGGGGEGLGGGGDGGGEAVAAPDCVSVGGFVSLRTETPSDSSESIAKLPSAATMTYSAAELPLSALL